MKMEMPIDTAAEFSSERKTTDIKQNFWVRAAAFVVSVAGGFLVARLVYALFVVLPRLADTAPDKAGPLLTILKLLRSGLAN